jgi:alkylation response protein AidB-like acyl-CoA dehydrogenase
VDKDKHADVRLEAALCKLWGTEAAWQIVDDTMQIRGGRGYETADSLRARGEEPEPVERFMRDCRINTIFEGSSEIMRLFIAREALDSHLKVAGAIFNSKLPMKARLGAAMKAGMFYARWYPGLLLPKLSKVPSPKSKADARLRGHLRFVERNSRKLARSLFHAMARFGPKLERQQLLLGRLVDVAAELFAMTATCARASKQSGKDDVALADYFCQSARLRIADLFRGVHHNCDRAGHRLAQDVLRA